ncbi:MAG TPA: hypothetical protein VHU81_18840 [Thermoanaerobaculia bacterium]|nr:hypothetical protein [Thermoanaerobaculia bacterium]
MIKTCELVECGVQFEAQSRRARFHSTTCRVKAHRGAPTSDQAPATVIKQEIIPPPAPEPPAAPDAEPVIGQLETLARAELEQAARLETTLGQAVIVLARRIDRGLDTGPGLASLVKQLEATLGKAVANSETRKGPVEKARDEIAERRAKRSA